MQFEFPELLILSIPVWFLYRRFGQAKGATGLLRVALLVALVLALSGPRINIGGRGVDVVVVADRSLSQSAQARDNIREIILNLEDHVTTAVGSGDRLSLVTFGTDSRVEYELANRISHTEFVKDINPNGSDLNAAILTALDRVDANRPARILILSDGEANGANPESAARRANEQGVPIDAREFERLQVGDVAIESVLLPETVAPREPFQYSVWIHAGREVSGTVQVSRDGREIARREADFNTGMNRLLFRDLLEDGGLHSYSVELKLDDDPLPENNTGAGVVRVDVGPRVLVLNSDGRTGNLERALTAARIPVDTAKASDHPLTQDSLDGYRAVVLENVPAEDFGRLKMERLTQFVEDLGGGLLMTGGKRSFGTGGYFKSPLEEILPVSMELREEHRKLRVAIAVALDRSGSMTAPVKGGKTKMDLANLGTAECVRMLSSQDMVSIIAVDSSPHVIVPLSPVDDAEAIAHKVLGIQSMGGGIFVYEALVEAGSQLMKAEGYSTRHIILFSDAQDSEEPGAYKALLKKYEAAGITVSVIGLGTNSDIDAKLLEDVAKLGSGNIMFTADAEELPRLFAQDTMSIARNTFVEPDPDTQPDGIPGSRIPDALLMGNLGNGPFPKADGYNLSYLRPEATAAVLSGDEYQAPWSAFWYRGLGRVAAITLEVDGSFSGQFGSWDQYEDFLVTHVRWLLGGGSSNDVFVKVEQSGQDAIVRLELDPERDDQKSTHNPELVIVPPGQEREDVLRPDFVWTGAHELEARFRLDQTGTYRTLVRTGERNFTRGPTITLPYSPEFAPRIGLPSGRETLARIAELSGGNLRHDVMDVFRNPPRSARTVSLLAPLMIAGIVLLLLEIAGRRLALWERLREVAQTPMAASTAQAETARSHAPGWLARIRIARERRQTARATRKFNTEKQASTAASTKESTQPSSPATDEKTPASDKTTASVFEQARKQARRRFKN
ncbi:MAG: VWA domain-containing protein [Planctomycetota bacterium]|nr:VWA domain-containing protein [Planctomycetota bacterium]MDA0921457.1 VWA domain-containing protein [Planctomycetota bacterium]MDA1161032.1 VWA domain-containing protein [Planctomycetota bacterium]